MNERGTVQTSFCTNKRKGGRKKDRTMADTRLIVPTITMEMGKARLQRERKKKKKL